MQPGQTLQFPVTLEPTSGGPGSVVVEPATAGGTGGFTLETTPPGAKVFLDGQELDGVTPVRIGNLLARRYSLKLQLADYREQTVAGRREARSGPDAAARGAAAGARACAHRLGAVGRRGQRGARCRAPRRSAARRSTSRSTTTAQPWTVEVNQAGFKLFTQPVDTSDGQREIAVKANLARAGGVAVAPPPEAVVSPRSRASCGSPRSASPSRWRAAMAATARCASTRAPGRRSSSMAAPSAARPR